MEFSVAMFHRITLLVNHRVIEILNAEHFYGFASSFLCWKTKLIFITVLLDLCISPKRSSVQKYGPCHLFV